MWSLDDPVGASKEPIRRATENKVAIVAVIVTAINRVVVVVIAGSIALYIATSGKLNFVLLR